jgi:hypothetical protein
MSADKVTGRVKSFWPINSCEYPFGNDIETNLLFASYLRRHNGFTRSMPTGMVHLLCHFGLFKQIFPSIFNVADSYFYPRGKMDELG